MCRNSLGKAPSTWKTYLIEVPETREWVDEDGIRTVESYKYNEDGQLIKTTRRIRDIKTIKRIPMRVYERVSLVSLYFS